MTAKFYSIKEAAAALNLSEVYVRRMVQKGKLPTQKVAVSEHVWKHVIPGEALEEWRKQVGAGRNRRADGRAKYSLYATADEFEALQQLLETEDLEVLIARANKVKSEAK